MPRPVRARLQDILDAAGHILRLVSERGADGIKSDLFAQAAIERFLEIVSEASRHVPDDLKARQPQIPWRRVADLGNRLRHVYQRVDFDLIWAICTDDLPAIVEAVESLVDVVDTRKS